VVSTLYNILFINLLIFYYFVVIYYLLQCYCWGVDLMLSHQHLCSILCLFFNESLSRFENFIPFVFRFFADLAGVEGPWVPLMLGDAPSLLEHLESNLKSNEFSKLSLAVRLRAIACYRDRFVCVFSFPIPHPPVRLSLSLILSTLPSLLVFLVGFSSFSFRLAPAEEAAGIVPLSSQFQRDGSYIPSGLSGREPWPFARKISLFPIFFFLHGLEFIGVE
jgi:hypothetical protein